MSETIDQIKIDEGYRAEPYLCPAGKLTWLYGRNLSARPIEREEWLRLTNILKDGGSFRQWAALLFLREITALESELMAIGINAFDHPVEVRAIILNMAYNMGTSRFNPKKWPNFFRCLGERDYYAASLEMVDSAWYRQVGNRSVRLVNSMQRIGRKINV